MDGVFLGFSIVLVIIGIGLLAAVLLPRGTTASIQHGLTPAIYYVTNPLLMVVLVTQLLLIAPVYLTVFGWCSRQRGSAQPRLARTVLASVANPVTVGTAVGAVLALVDWVPPEFLWTPMDMLGRASIPLLLFVFGLSLASQRPFRDRSQVPDIVWGSFVKLALMPVVAWAVGHGVFGLEGVELFGVVAMAALPTAQNVYLFSSQFKLPNLLVRDIVFSSAVLSLPVILVVALLLEP